jgi:hypothetical protein
MSESEKGAAQKRYMDSGRNVAYIFLTSGVNGPVKQGEEISLHFTGHGRFIQNIAKISRIGYITIVYVLLVESQPSTES